MRKLINSPVYVIVCIAVGLLSLILSAAINNLNIASVFLFIFAISFVLSLLPCVVAEKE